MNKRILLVVVLLAIVVALSAPARAGSERVERTINYEGPLAGGASIRIENLIGSLTVRADTIQDKILVEAQVVTEDDSKAAAKELAETIRIDDVSEGGQRIVRVGYPVDRYSAFRLPRSEKDGLLAKWITPLVKKSTVSTDYQGRTVEVGQAKGAPSIAVHVKVTIPLETLASFRQVAGTLHVVGVRGDFALEAVDGQILAEQIYGQLKVRTGGGEIVVHKFVGDGLSLQTASGKMNLIDAKADQVSLVTGSGRIEGSGISVARLQVESGEGGVFLDDVDSVAMQVESEAGDVDIGARLTRTREASIQASAGDVTLRLNPTTPFELHAAAENGSVKHRDVGAEVLEEEKNSLHLVRGQGGCALDIKAGKGAVLIRAI